jgi:hydrogenase maturation protease
MKKTLILGIGNILLSDEGLGVHAVKRILGSGIAIPDDVEIIDGGTAGFDLLELLMGRKKIIIVDALRVDDAPGSIYRFPPEHIASSLNAMSLHEFGIRELIAMLRMLGHDPEIEIIGIVPSDVSTFNMCLSAEVENSMPRTIDLIMGAAAEETCRR